ncbi:MAG: 3-deoxy-D-manno-octulosonic acid transferase, partial [Flavobacteriales bacterium]
VYLPSDTIENARRFILHFHPDKVFFVKYEFWSNYIFEAKKQNVQIFSICSLFRNDHRFFKWYGGFFRETLKNIDFFYTQNEVSSLLLGDIGITNFKTTGDTRFDRVIENKEQLEPNIRIESFLKGETAVIIGSSWPEDEEIIVRFILKNPDRKFIIAPHNVDDQHVKELKGKLAGRAVLFTDDQTGGHVLILNTIGHLASAYAYGNVAYVGGGFSGNLHNILEPAVFGLPVIFGPKFKRFPEAFQFIHLGIGYAVKDLEGFENAYSRIMAQSGELSTITINFVEKNRGASVKVLDHIEQVFGM